MSPEPVIIFVCEHGAAKSIIAAAYFNKLAREAGLAQRAIARGTHPDSELSQNTVAGLRGDSLEPTEQTPRKLLTAEVVTAERLVTFCEIPEEYQTEVPTEEWNDVPPVSENYEKARDAILKKLHQLIQRL
jgi:protein-tyrosine-phosphatase